MQINQNTTGMEAGICVSTNKEGYEFCVVVVKGTFSIENNGDLVLAKEQAALVYTDEHYGDPGSTPIKYESDFAPYKPRTDILVNGHAYSETGKPVSELLVGLSVGQVKKIVKVYGNRVWQGGVSNFKASAPEPFLKIPLTYDRAYGGSDNSHQNQNNHSSEMRNLVGTGYLINSDFENIHNTQLPNLEDPSALIRSWSDKPIPMGFGFVGRGWQPRINYAGTYDKQWVDDCFPFLPSNFDEHYFLSSPGDQQLPALTGGEKIRCLNMTPQHQLTMTVPKIEIPVVCRFFNRMEKVIPKLDTFLIEPDQGRVQITWRCRVALGRKLNALREIRVGHAPSAVRRNNGKLHFKSISDYVQWKRSK